MTNTVYGPYAKTTWVNGSTPANATNLSNLEKQSDAALHGFNPDLIGSGFVLSGVTCAKDGTIANQLDIASGRAYVLLSDGTVGLIVVGADNTHTTSALSSTYHLWLQPDGSWYWNTLNAPVANSLHICDVATDGSGNITTVTDTRTLNAALLAGMAGALVMPAAGIAAPSGNDLILTTNSTTNPVVVKNTTIAAGGGGAPGIGWNYVAFEDSAGVRQGYMGMESGTGNVVLTTLISGSGISLPNPVAKINSQATAGSFGVSPIVASAYGVAVSATTNQTILTYTPGSNGLYRVSGAVTKQNATSNQVTMQVSYTDPFSGVAGQVAFFQTAGNGVAFNLLSGGTNDQSLGAWTYSLIPITFHAKSGSAITVLYQDPSGTPNDNVSALIERLA